MICVKCQQPGRIQATYCGNCGWRLGAEKEGDYNIHTRNVIFFFFVMVAYILVLNFTGYGDDYVALLTADAIFAVIVLIFFAKKFRSNKRLLNAGKFNKKLISNLLLVMPLGAILVHFLAGFLNQSVFDSSGMIYYEQFRDSPAPFLLCVLSIAVFPAIFEEIAFRGILFDESLKLFGLKPTIIFTSILFTLLHLSVISALWIFPLGLLFGYLRARYNTLIYGIIGHFLYNTGIVMMEMLFNLF